ncbi:hypothetical protein EMPS_06676 [Entomortierella parvispora]|uniref:Uncharacterized protein n=1 Tax=Entomortierella parvispora TaxID=205924 RepID=A0A9P3LXP3_9FUNG|nr:hypothetical protein EMPS_06676 [Entomortierella parvispora]
MWMSFMDAALHYTRLSLELAPIGRKTQISVHAAPGVTPTGPSVIINNWTAEEQSLDHVASQLQVLRQATTAAAASAEDSSMEEEQQQGHWIEQALQGAIAHILETSPMTSVPTAPLAPPPASQKGAAAPIPPAPVTSSVAMAANIVIVLADEDPRKKVKAESRDVAINGGGRVNSDQQEDQESAWSYGDGDLRKMLYSVLHSLRDAIKSTKVPNIHVDFIRISSSQDCKRLDVIGKDISRVCTASVYTVKTVDDRSTTAALTNHFLSRNKDVHILRVHNMSLTSRTKDLPVDVLYRTSHIKPRVPKAENSGSDTSDHRQNYLQHKWTNVKELEHGISFTEETRLLPTKCFHPAAISSLSLSVSFYAAVSNGAIHLLNDVKSPYIASMALLDRDGQLYIHCLDQSEDSQEFSLFSSVQRPVDVSQNHLEDFVKVIIGPNEISPGQEAFAAEGNKLSTIVPTALKPTFNQSEPRGVDDESPSSSSVNMSLVNTTSRLDLETRWMVQWEGERIHPILPAHEYQLKQFRTAICRAQVTAEGLTTIQSVLDALISDARPLALPGEHNPLPAGGKMNLQQQRLRECAQAVVADIWMIGQRFKTVSTSHLEAAKLIAGKVTPKGLDHQAVKRTLIPPKQRMAMVSAEMAASPNVGGSMNDGGFGRGRGGARSSFSARGGAMAGGAGVGRGRGGPGGFRGGHSGGMGGNSPVLGDGGNSDGTMVVTGENDIMLSMTGKTQPVPYLTTTPPTRDEIEESEQEYLSQLGEDGCLLKAYWGSRGAQGSSLAVVLNSMHSLDTVAGPVDTAAPRQPQLHQQQRPGGLKKGSIKRLRLQDFAGRTPVVENGGHSTNSNQVGSFSNMSSRAVDM